ncbi:MAG: hypothetical protein VKL39_22095 [Leptolyngbyaceae bacterium]|nr:hypothetical protein [Leptolyngbyaceae bacterium]
MTTIRDVVTNAAAIFSWEKEAAKATNEQRKEYYGLLFDAMRENADISEGDMVNATNLLGVELTARKFKRESIYTRRSEFRRIWENIGLVDSETASWQGALKDIRNATVPESVRMLDAMAALQEKIEAMQKQLAETYEQWQALDPTVATTIVFSDEHEEQRKAA